MSLPASRPTSCVFSSSNLDVLLVTSASVGLHEVSSADGSVFGVTEIGTSGFQRMSSRKCRHCRKDPNLSKFAAIENRIVCVNFRECSSACLLINVLEVRTVV